MIAKVQKQLAEGGTLSGSPGGCLTEVRRIISLNREEEASYGKKADGPSSSCSLGSGQKGASLR